MNAHKREPAMRREPAGKPDAIEEDGWMAQDVGRCLAGVDVNQDRQDAGRHGHIACAVEEKTPVLPCGGKECFAMASGDAASLHSR